MLVQQKTVQLILKQVQIVAVGSTALQPLVESAQEQFVAKNANYQITVQGGGIRYRLESSGQWFGANW